MFLFEKYRPTKVSDFLFNQDILSQLLHFASNENIPHIIISGPAGGGKKTLVKFFLEELYDENVNNLTKLKYNIKGSSSKKEIEIMQSDYHIVIKPTNTNHDKYILQEIIKQYTLNRPFDIFPTKRKFKTVVIHNIENLATNSQAALRRTMELYAKTCRFIMICNNLSKIFDPLRSRCRIFCVPLPTRNDIFKIVSSISIMENIKLKKNEMKMILDQSGNDMKKAIWILDAIRFKTPTSIMLDNVFDRIIDSIFKIANNKTRVDITKVFDHEIRMNIYNILITNIKGSDVITTLMDRLIEKINDDRINIQIVRAASDAEYNLICGRRDIIHIDFFVSTVLRILKNYNPDPVTNK